MGLKDEVEGRALPDGPFGPDPPAVPVDDAPGGGEPDPGARKLALAVEALERAKEPVRVDHVEAGAIVLDEDPRLALNNLLADRDPRRALDARELPRVVDQVGEEDPDQALVAGGDDARGDFHRYIAVGIVGPHLLHDLVRKGADVDLFAPDLAARQPEQHLQPVENRRHPAAGVAHLLQVFGGATVELGAIAVEQRLTQAVEGNQRRAQVMGDRISERFELTVDGGEGDSALFDQRLELGSIAAQLLLGAVELDKDADLCPQDGGDHRRKDKVDRAKVVAAAHVRLRLVERRYEDERRQLRTRS